MLEVIERTPQRESGKAPLLFVHGAWHGAWCYDEYFLDFFAEKGYRALALSLRGHGNSTAPKFPRLCSTADFVDDVDSVARRLPEPPVLIGHFMGGFVVQKYLESHDAPAAVLLASVPPSGITGFLLGRFKRHPWLTVSTLTRMRSLRGIGGTPELAREAFFSASNSDADVARYTALLCEEYAARIAIDMLWVNLPKPHLVTTPLLVLGAEDDACFTQKEVLSTAAAYRTEAEFFPKMSHDVMLDPGWVAVAERIHVWLETLAAQRKSIGAAGQAFDPMKER
ncbi:alpha/beta hydrolase [Mycobacterium montefiorense]|uniref:alpha/beta hydrolase n=1 Tax=Mycobacterium montefiorense TaxID=154654 RepID=UPI0021DE4258|nr:lysophospholipase [Mycobacterium montefiorense]MCV7425204.1 alpha/beta fold hydrolase [Mycobacterium montefiorense]GLE53248.1 alpha/beta hydrolase [Mycobacterium montefiorense]